MAFARGIMTEVSWTHPWHPDHRRYLWETYAHILRHGGQAPFMDAIPTNEEEAEGIELPDALYIELQSILSTTRSFEGVHARRT